MWNTKNWSEVGSLLRDSPGAGLTAFDPQGIYIALLDRNMIRLYDAESLQEVVQLAAPLDASLERFPGLTAGGGPEFSPDGRAVVARTSDGSILLWDLDAIQQSLREWNLDWRER